MTTPDEHKQINKIIRAFCLGEVEVIKVLEELDTAYYNGEGLIPDSEYDFYYKEARIEFPNNPYFNNVGAPVTFGKKLTHKVPMLSLGKDKTTDGSIDWWGRVEDVLGLYPVLYGEPKADGVAGKVSYNHGKLEIVVTRGNGTIGRVITHVKDYIDIPHIIDKDEEISISGEFVLPRKNALTKDKLRNVCAGLLNRESDLDDLKHIKFLAYNVEYKGGKFFKEESHKISFLKNNDFYTPDCQIIRNRTELENYYDLYLKVLRDKWEFETDGLVFVVNDCSLHEKIDSNWTVDHHHHYARALKPPSKGADTTLLDIEWNISRHGNLIPVAVFKPIEIDGVQIQRCTLHNYETVLKEKFSRGDILHILRSNDVIPYFDKKVYDAKVQNTGGLILTSCPSCKGTLVKKGVHLHCSSKDCPEQDIQQLVYWCKKAEMDGISESTIRTLYDNACITNIKSLFYLHTLKSKLVEIEGFGEKKVNNLISEIDRVRKMTFQQFIERLGIELVGKKALKKLNINTVQDFVNFGDSQYVIGQNLIDYRNENKYLVQSLLKEVDIQVPVAKKAGNKSICMTGKGPKGRKELITMIEDKGDEFVDSMTKDTDVLLCEDPNGSSSKLKTAAKLGIKVVAYSDYFKG